MRSLAVVAWSILAVAGYGQEKEAEKLFRSMEKKVRAAKSLKIVCQVQGRLHEGGEQNRVKASQQFAGANKARFELHTETGGSTFKTLFVSDGTKMVTLDSDTVAVPQRADAKLNDGIPAAIARGGFMLPRVVVRREKGSLNADKTLLIGSFKLGSKERVGKFDAQAVEHSVRFGGLTIGPGGRESVRVTVWIDPKTFMPLKRKVVVGDGEGDFFTEVYTELIVDPKLDPKVFELPK